jgi:PAS domain S-box-containing protein
MSRIPTEDPLDVVASTADAAFATDEEGRVVIWNKAAERLLGQDAASVLGRPCHEVLRGRDYFGNRFCGESCSVMEMVRNREPVRHFEMEIAKSSGETMQATFSIVVIPGSKPTRFTIVHLFQPAGRGREADELVRRILKTSAAPAPPALIGISPASGAVADVLTARELEVLRFMADGASTQRIADALFISTATVRNHTQHILDKLDVHSKLEAVSLAYRNRLI